MSQSEATAHVPGLVRKLREAKQATTRNENEGAGLRKQASHFPTLHRLYKIRTRGCQDFLLFIPQSCRDLYVSLPPLYTNMAHYMVRSSCEAFRQQTGRALPCGAVHTPFGRAAREFGGKKFRAGMPGPCIVTE